MIKLDTNMNVLIYKPTVYTLDLTLSLSNNSQHAHLQACWPSNQREGARFRIDKAREIEKE